MSIIERVRMSPQEVQMFQEFLMESSGLYFEGRRIEDMERAIVGRMVELGYDSFADYYHLLTVQRSGKDELNRLVLSLTVGETQFFRTPDQFAALRKYIFPELVESRCINSRRLRFLSAGCATGEEAFTLAILLQEELPDLGAWNVTIRACDINQDFLEYAGKALYTERKMKLVDQYLREKYFEPRNKRYKVNDEVRDMVDFMHFNLASADYLPLTQGEPYDVVLCRNVLIYFNQENIRRVISQFYNILADGGYLILGYSETLFKLNDSFQSIHTPEAFFYRKGREQKPRVDMDLPRTQKPLDRQVLLQVLGSQPHPRAVEPQNIPTLLPTPAVECRAEEKPVKTGPEPERDELSLWEEGTLFFSEEQFDRARASFEAMLKINPCSARAHLGLGFLYANSGADDRSREAIAKAKECDDLLPEIYFLLALLDEKNDKLAGAMENYQRVILLDPQFAMAHFNLANLYLHLDRPRDGRREFVNTLNILERDRGNASLKFSGGLSREALLQICEMHRGHLRPVSARG